MKGVEELTDGRGRKRQARSQAGGFTVSSSRVRAGSIFIRYISM